MPAGNYVRRLLLRIAQNDRVSAGDYHLRRIAVDDAVADENSLLAIDGGPPALQLESVGPGIEYRFVTLISRRRVSGALHQLLHDRIGFVPLDEISRGGVGPGTVSPRCVRTSPGGVHACRHTLHLRESA